MFLYTWITVAIKIFVLYIWHGRTNIFYNNALQILRDENILFTKIFQSLTNSSYLDIPPDLRLQLQRYTTNTSYRETEVNYELIDEIEASYKVQIDRRVINSGMIALIFKGTNAEGRPIIVKLKRRDILTQLRRGCRSVAAFYGYASYFFPSNIMVRILRPFIQNIDDIIEQCDFDHEISNLRQAKEDFAQLTFIHIPSVYNRTDRIQPTEFILMDFIEGSHMLAPSTTEEVRLQYIEYFAIFTSYSYLFNAIHHTDLHIGNIIFTPTGLGIIDFGMAIQASEETHSVLLGFAEILREERPIHEIDFIDTFKDLFIPPLIKEEMDDVAVVEEMCMAIAQPLMDTIDIDELHITDKVAELGRYLKKDIVLNREFYTLILGIVMMGCKVAIMGPDYNDMDKLKKIERNGINKAYEIIMMTS